MSLQEFIEKYNGEYLEVAGSSAQNQCVDLANAYLRDVLNHPIVEWTNATDFPSKLTDFEWIQNTPDGVPQEGDIIVWQNSTYGHIAIFVEGNTTSFRSFDQNFPTGSPCHIQNHTYITAMCWGRPKEPTVEVASSKFQELVHKSTLYDSFFAAGYASVEDILKEKEVLNNEKNDIQNQLTAEIQKNQDLRDVLDKQTQADADLGAQLLEAQHKLAELEQAKEQPIAEAVKPLQDHALDLQDALSDLIYKKAPNKSQPLLKKIVSWIFSKWNF